MLVEQTIGILILTLPILFVGYLLLRRMLPVFWFLAALVLVGTGYLVITGAATDVGRATLAMVGGGKAGTPVQLQIK